MRRRGEVEEWGRGGERGVALEGGRVRVVGLGWRVGGEEVGGRGGRREQDVVLCPSFRQQPPALPDASRRVSLGEARNEGRRVWMVGSVPVLRRKRHSTSPVSPPRYKGNLSVSASVAESFAADLGQRQERVVAAAIGVWLVRDVRRSRRRQQHAGQAGRASSASAAARAAEQRSTSSSRPSSPQHELLQECDGADVAEQSRRRPSGPPYRRRVAARRVSTAAPPTLNWLPWSKAVTVEACPTTPNVSLRERPPACSSVQAEGCDDDVLEERPKRIHECCLGERPASSSPDSDRTSCGAGGGRGGLLLLRGCRRPRKPSSRRLAAPSDAGRRQHMDALLQHSMCHSVVLGGASEGRDARLAGAAAGWRLIGRLAGAPSSPLAFPPSLRNTPSTYLRRRACRQAPPPDPSRNTHRASDSARPAGHLPSRRRLSLSSRAQTPPPSLE